MCRILETFDETFLSIGVSFLHNIYSSQQIYDRSDPTKTDSILLRRYTPKLKLNNNMRKVFIEQGNFELNFVALKVQALFYLFLKDTC